MQEQWSEGRVLRWVVRRADVSSMLVPAEMYAAVRQLQQLIGTHSSVTSRLQAEAFLEYFPQQRIHSSPLTARAGW